jgi:hypothetical protein
MEDGRRKRNTENKGGVKEKERKKKENEIWKVRSVERKGKEH